MQKIKSDLKKLMAKMQSVSMQSNKYCKGKSVMIRIYKNLREKILSDESLEEKKKKKKSRYT